MPRIALDVTAARLGQAGSAVYITSLQRGLSRVLGDRLHAIASRWAAPLGARRTLGDRARTLLRDLWWHQVGVCRAARRGGCGLLHMPAGLGPVMCHWTVYLTAPSGPPKIVRLYTPACPGAIASGPAKLP